MIWQQSQEPKPSELLPAQTTVPTEVDTTLKTDKEGNIAVPCPTPLLGTRMGSRWGRGKPKQNKSFKCCREDEHQGYAAEKVPSGQSMQELLVVMRRQ